MCVGAVCRRGGCQQALTFVVVWMSSPVFVPCCGRTIGLGPGVHPSAVFARAHCSRRQSQWEEATRRNLPSRVNAMPLRPRPGLVASKFALCEPCCAPCEARLPFIVPSLLFCRGQRFTLAAGYHKPRVVCALCGILLELAMVYRNLGHYGLCGSICAQCGGRLVLPRMYS